MKKRLILFIFLFIIFLCLSFITINADTTQNIELSIVVAGSPSIVIITPQNITYNVSSIPLNFIYDGADNFWYNLDNGDNISISGNTTFSAWDGSHLLRLFANNSYGVSEANVSFTVRLEGAMAWPEGVYEPNATGLPGTHRFAFTIGFNSITAQNGSVIECDILESDGTLLILNKTIISNLTNSIEQLNYTLQPSDSINKTSPWKINNCTVSYEGNITMQTTNFGVLNGSIYVHGNNWTRFSSVDDDAYRAGDCFLGIPKRYFNNSYYCDYAGDVAFAVTMSRGMNLEGECHDSIDNDGNGNADCADIYCRGITYSCINHSWAGDPFGGTCTNGICTETKSVGGKSFTYTYTRYLKQNGTLKLRIEGNSYSTAAPVSFAITDLKGFIGHGKYNRTGYLMLPNDEVSLTSYKTENPSGVNGNIDMVMYVNLNSTNYSEGTHEFSLYVRQYGEDLLIAGIPIVVRNDAPTNWNEHESLSGIIDGPCADSVDNDLDYAQNCNDMNCTGYIGGTDCTGADAFCQATESTCYDCFDNDADGQTDCADPNCDLMSGNYQNLADLCEYMGEGYGALNATYNSIYSWTSACADSFNNDREDGTDCYDTTHCRGKGGTSTTLPCPAYENNSAAWCFDLIDNDYDGNIGCADTDCIGVSYAGRQCYQNETMDSAGAYVPGRCFDGIDNDLDGQTDCADSNCWGITNPNNYNQTCEPLEFNVTIPYQYCNDNFDNNRNSLVDCNDLSCKTKFEVCGPCPSIENYTWRACADALDNDYNGQSDCSDANCAGEIGNTASGQRCGTEICNDNFDNDADGAADCGDSGCNGQTGVNGETCEPAAETSCSDDFDNDGDGLIDCADSDCFGVGTCALSWTDSSCIDVPYTSIMAQVASTTVSVSHLARHYINTNYTIVIMGTGSYSVVTITLGDATDSSKYFPYNATTCTLSGNSKLKWVASQSQVGQIQHDPGQVSSSSPLNGFDVLLTCSPLGSPQTKSYPITIANLNNGYSETGETSVSTTVYENTAPTISTIEIEPTNGNLTYGGALKIRVVPDSDSSGICKCYLNVSNIIYESSDGNCMIALSNLKNDASYTISAKARDGANNLGPSSTPQSFSLNINPKSSTTTLNRNEPFYRAGDYSTATISAAFTAADNDLFSSNCYYTLRNSSAVISSGTVSNTGSGNSASCTASVTVPTTDNLYYMQMNITDSDGADVNSDSKVLYVCNNLSSKDTGWTCEKADFDQDGFTEGIYTSLFGTPKTCDELQEILSPPAPPVTTIPSPPGQGGQPPGPKEIADIRVNPSDLRVKINPGETQEITFSIKNIGKSLLSLAISSNLGEFFSVNGQTIYNFYLQPNEELPLKVTLSVPKDQEIGIYFGYISIIGSGIEKIIPVTLEVGIKEEKFSVNLVIPQEFKTIRPGEPMTTMITIFNVKPPVEGKNATVRYTVKDINNGIAFESSETRILENQAYSKTLNLPVLPEGAYILYAEVRYENMVAADYEEFTISLIKPAPAIPILRVSISVLLAAILIALLIAIISIMIKRIIKYYHSLGPGTSTIWNPFKKM